MDDVCVVTQPLGESDPTATSDLLKILSEFTAVSLVTVALGRNQSLRDEYEVTEISPQPMGESIMVAAYRFLRNQVRMALVISRRDEQLIHFFGSQAYFLPILAARLSGKTVIVQPRANVSLSLYLQWQQRVPKLVARLLSGFVAVLEQIGCWLSHAIITYSSSMAEELGVDRYDEKLFTNGARFIDTDQFSPETPLEDRPMAVGFVGRLVEEKGIKPLVAIVKELPNEIAVRIVGDGPLRGWLEEQLDEELAEGRLNLLGWVDHDELNNEYNRMRLLVVPSAPTEGLPTVILEAMSCGTPVYATSVSGVPDVVSDGETGRLMRDRRPVENADTIAEMVADSELRRMSDACRNRILEHYTFDRAVDRYKTIFETLS